MTQMHKYRAMVRVLDEFNRLSVKTIVGYGETEGRARKEAIDSVIDKRNLEILHTELSTLEV